MFDPLLWVLPHFITNYAGQTTQGDTNDGDAVDKVSISKDATSLPLGTTPTTLPTTLQESNTSDQSDASSSTDFRPKKVCKGGYWLRKISSPCPQQQSQPGSQPSTLYDPPQSDEMPLPVSVDELEVESYSEIRKTDQYIAFTQEEAQYFESEYLFERELGEGQSGIVFLATRKSDGLKVAYKSIPYTKTYKYTLESSPPPRCHLPDSLVRSEEPSVARCMSSRPPNPLIPYEFLLQKYLSRPGHENPYVPMALDYIILKDAFILVMEYVDESWVSLSKYVDEKGKPDIETARDIVKEVVNGMIYLKQYGIVHNDLNGQVKLLDFGAFAILPGWEEGKSVPSKSPDSSPTILGYKAEFDELWKHCYSTHSFAHLVVECEQVTGHRIQSGLVPAIQKSRLRLLGRALDPGVENVYTWLRGGVINGEADLDQRWLDGDCGA
ncbi:hypothetical protein BASA60_004840 [Batrachochytrium salamandrivorans]|nr:hypothetical protein BASA60_004840 [Batrachochytrium salamandrivorans]